jgi:L-amino acid N-acyltransferase YncA
LNQNKNIMNVTVEKMKDEDWPAVKEIYQEGIDTGNATFESEAPEWKQWNKSHLHECRLVAKSEEKIVGWVALSPVSERCAYQGVAEVSLYVKSSARGQGVGKTLLKAVIEKSERLGIWTLQAGTFPENVASSWHERKNRLYEWTMARCCSYGTQKQDSRNPNVRLQNDYKTSK